MFFYPLHQISPEIRVRKKVCWLLYNFHGIKIKKSDLFYFKCRIRKAFRRQVKIFAGITVGVKIFTSKLWMHDCTPFFDLNTYNIEPLRSFEDCNDVSKVACAFSANEWLDMYLRSMKNRNSMVGDRVNDLLGVGRYTKA